MFKPRDYQQGAIDAVIGFIKKSTDSCIVEAATGAGKSIIIAEIVRILNGLSGGKRVLCLAPSAELVTQNREKYLATGEPASIFSASAGGKCLKHPAVFGTPVTVLNGIERFGGKFCAVIIDECDLITPTVKKIISKLQGINPKLRVIGMTATPYRLGSGYIYQLDENGKLVNPNGYFIKKVCTITAQYLIEQGYLTRPIVGSINTGNYNTINMSVNARGLFDKSDIDKAYKGQGRKTAAIVADVIEQSRNRRGVMFFAATVQHAEEILESLPPELSAIITGETKKKERGSIIARFKSQQIKYIVNVSVLTVGFDAPHVDVVALLRATESARLLQQIIGRALRIYEEKDDALILDYAQNIERHCPDGDLFNPEITENYKSKESEIIKVNCPDCNNTNEFNARPNDDGYLYSDDGYFLDLMGNKIETEFGYVPSHYGRRCEGYILAAGTHSRCSYRWTYKECEKCSHNNDIAARYCESCKAEIIDPNDKLIDEEQAAINDPYSVKTSKVTSWHPKNSLTRNGDNCIVVDVTTEATVKPFRIWLLPESKSRFAIINYSMAMQATSNLTKPPVTITYQKNSKSKFYEIRKYNDEV